MTFPAPVYLCALHELAKLPQLCGLVSLSRLALTAILVILGEVEESQKKMTKNYATRTSGYYFGFFIWDFFRHSSFGFRHSPNGPVRAGLVHRST